VNRLLKFFFPFTTSLQLAGVRLLGSGGTLAVETARVSALALLGMMTFYGAAGARADDQPADVTLHGVLLGKDNHTYRLLPFTVPPGTFRITVNFEYSGKGQHTALDLGLFDPHGFRGWSGGDKPLFTVSAADATPSYLPGTITPGQWQLLISVPNIRPNVSSEFTAKIYFALSGAVAEEPAVLLPQLRSGPGWYRGDLHSHTAHSDGGCESQSKRKVPCPLFLTAEAAAERGLDFLAITDHNTISHFSELRELQPFFDKLLLIPGREITTFQGHANLYGTTEFIDFRVSSDSVPTWNALLEALPKQGVVLSINHPSRITGEACMGCGWHPDPDIDWHLIHVMEAVNGNDTRTQVSGIAFWQSKLNDGLRITAIGGGDNHDARAPLPGPGSIGFPTTVVYANSLSTPAILAGILDGQVFIDVTGSKDRNLEFTAGSGDQRAVTGSTLRPGPGTSVVFQIHTEATIGGHIEVIEDGETIRPLETSEIRESGQSFSFTWKATSGRHWFRVNVRDNDGKLWLVGNPIYINFE
jgi:hypothetical protein